MTRALGKGLISERDRLFGYTTGEFYQELSFYIEEVEIHNKEMEKVFKK